MAKIVAAVLMTVGMCPVHAFAQTGTIEGRVIDSDGAPLAGIVVTVDRLGIRQHFQTTTDTKGKYRHIGIPSGRYQISLVRNGQTGEVKARLRELKRW